MKGRLLVVEDDRLLCTLLMKHFAGTYRVAGFTDPEDAVRYLREKSVDVVLTDLNMPKLGGLDILKLVKAESFETDVIVMTAFAGVDTAVEAMKRGAYDYIVKPFTLDELSLLMNNVFEKRRLYDENANLRRLVETKRRPGGIIGESEAMKEIFRLIERIAPREATVLITGESGTGKGVVAKALHLESKRRNEKFVSINCTAIPEALLESELFGYAKGAFSGAVRNKTGLLEYANGGTILLDEIGDAGLPVQAKLLRVLQDGRFRPVGSTEEIEIDVRVICATNRDIGALIEENRFREDLFYRINVVSLHLPPLRERRDDIPFLVHHFLEGRKKIHAQAMGILARHQWPGNVRELRNTIERAVALADTDTILPGDLPPEMLRMPCILDDRGLSYNELKKKVIDEFNNAVISKYLMKHHGNTTKAAEELRLDRANFLRLLRKCGIAPRDFRKSSAPSDGRE